MAIQHMLAEFRRHESSYMGDIRENYIRFESFQLLGVVGFSIFGSHVDFAPSNQPLLREGDFRGITRNRHTTAVIELLVWPAFECTPDNSRQQTGVSSGTTPPCSSVSFAGCLQGVQYAAEIDLVRDERSTVQAR